MMSIEIRTTSIRTALADLRKDLASRRGEQEHSAGHLGFVGLTLDDGTRLSWALKPSSDGGRLMGVYEARREMLNGDVKTYPL